jgi:hypothetical protein
MCTTNAGVCPPAGTRAARIRSTRHAAEPVGGERETSSLGEDVELVSAYPEVTSSAED